MQSEDRSFRPPANDILNFGPDGVDGAALIRSLEGWVRSEAMRRLATASGWSWPEGPLRTTLAELASQSADWDFRRRGERHGLTSMVAEVRGNVLDEGMIRAAATELGLAGGRSVTGSFSHVVVLGGMALACLRRTREAARLVDQLGVSRVAMLTAHRPLAGTEPADALEAGWGALQLESEAAEAAVRDVFGLPSRPDSEEAWWWESDLSEVPVDVAPVEWRRRRSWAHRRWRMSGLDVEVIVAPSGEPSARRTNTADQLGFWARLAAIGRSHHLLLVTTDHYVPAQHFEAIRAVGLEVGCGVTTCGVEWVSTGPYQGAAYLQEIRSALLAAVRLVDAADEAEGPEPR
jgi:hypothetical protein